MKELSDLDKKVLELWTLEKRLHRYWKKLVTVAIGVAKEKGIQTQIIQFGDVISGSSKIYIYQNGDVVYADKLLELARDVVPSLYRRYKTGKEIYIKEKKELEMLYGAGMSA